MITTDAVRLSDDVDSDDVDGNISTWKSDRLIFIRPVSVCRC